MLTVSKIGERHLGHFKALTLCSLPNISHSQTRRNYIFDVKQHFLRLLQTYLRNRTTEDCLNGSTMIYIYATETNDVDRVIDRFANAKKRRLLLL